MRIINTFNDLDLLKRLYPICDSCQHIGDPLDEHKLNDSFGSIVAILHKLKCKQCRSKYIYLRVVSNPAMPLAGERALFSDNIKTVQ